MALIILYLEAFFILLCIIISLNHILKKNHTKNRLPTSWPVFGMLPAIMVNCHRIYEYATYLLQESGGGGTFKVEGGCFRNVDMVLTSDPANINHILCKNFQNYPKGPEFRKIFEIFGDGIINADLQLWELHRKVTMSLMNNSCFYRLLETSVWEKIQNGLLSVLDNFEKNNISFDLQDIFQRFTFDTISNLVLDFDPESLSIGLPYIPCEKAFNDAAEACLYRHIMPEGYWKMQKWLGIGLENKLSLAWEAFDSFIYGSIEKKLDEINRNKSSKKDGSSDFITAFMEAYKGQSTSAAPSFSAVKVFLRDTMLTLILAGRDPASTALTWLFWLLATNPSVKTKVVEEIEAKLGIIPRKKGEKSMLRRFTFEESRNLVYLHGAVCEALRLYPPVPFNQKSSIHADVLPSGIQLDQNTKVVLSFYSMGRMESVWGKDCLEFKPERWICERGKIKHEPSYKFPAFNAGPRTCLGKEMSFFQMKMVATTIILNYDIHVVQGQQISPKNSVVLQMKKGLMVTLSKRS